MRGVSKNVRIHFVKEIGEVEEEVKDVANYSNLKVHIEFQRKPLKPVNLQQKQKE